ncbi:NAD(P)H-dependent oxidoreductase [Mycobacteroides immunogenum]|uniref:NADPH-dependent FMN reductase n=1 Tax=Mycobacteroides immunogenum TaxID=83262 RepID=UPI0025B76A30|nr:NAD(P)H-dependent oxidoreductase [Mycobacteroides immunogenum]WJR32168.1 NAD(P)H-dependent oxidoreductase [Mycobacteroides immunogenum]
MVAPLIVGLGGTVKRESSTESALRFALDSARSHGARTEMFGGSDLASLQMYDPRHADNPTARRFIESLRAAQGVIIASPGYHGSISGLVKNALDYVEELRDDTNPYLSGRAVGCITTAYGWQAAVTTLQTLRSIVHALRGWPTPLGAAINSAESRISYGSPLDGAADFQLRTVGREVFSLSTGMLHAEV